jgi:hypothetical protein
VSRGELGWTVRAMFFLYALLIVTAVVFFVVIGLTRQ